MNLAEFVTFMYFYAFGLGFLILAIFATVRGAKEDEDESENLNSK